MFIKFPKYSVFSFGNFISAADVYSIYLWSISYTLIYSASAGPVLQRDNIFSLPHSSFNRYFFIIIKLSLDINAFGYWLLSQSFPQLSHCKHNTHGIFLFQCLFIFIFIKITLVLSLSPSTLKMDFENQRFEKNLKGK